jgi:hypothetical protein
LHPNLKAGFSIANDQNDRNPRPWNRVSVHAQLQGPPDEHQEPNSPLNSGQPAAVLKFRDGVQWVAESKQANNLKIMKVLCFAKNATLKGFLKQAKQAMALIV